jgi:NADH:ubiquinone oxidoreductase subunit C
MGKIVSPEFQKTAAEVLAVAASVIEGVDAEVAERSSGTSPRHVVVINALPGSWRNLAENLYSEHAVDYCSMVTGIHWPEGDEERKWEVVYHLMRTGVRDPPIEDGIVQPIIVDPSKLRGASIPLEIEIHVHIPDTTTPSVDSVQDIWIGADWNEKETWDLVGIDFDGHQGMRRVLQPHETPKGYHPLQKQHHLRYHGFEEMYDDVQGFKRKPADVGKIK